MNCHRDNSNNPNRMTDLGKREYLYDWHSDKRSHRDLMHNSICPQCENEENLLQNWKVSVKIIDALYCTSY